MRKLIHAMNVFGKYSSFISSTSASILVICIALLVIVDVLGRGIFGKSTLVAEEMSRFMLIAALFLGLAHTQKMGRHIKLDLFTSKLSQRKREGLETITLMLALFLVSWLAYITVEPAVSNYVMHVKSLHIIRTPMWIPHLFVPLGLTMFAIQLFIELINKVGQMIYKVQPVSNPGEDHKISGTID